MNTKSKAKKALRLFIGALLLSVFASCSDEIKYIKFDGHYMVRPDSTILFHAEPSIDAETWHSSKYGVEAFSVAGTSYDGWVEVYIKSCPYAGLSEYPEIDSTRAFINKTSFQRNAVRSIYWGNSSPTFYAEPRKSSYTFGAERLSEKINSPDYYVSGNIEGKEWVQINVRGTNKAEEEKRIEEATRTGKWGSTNPKYRTIRVYIPRGEFDEKICFSPVSYTYRDHTLLSYAWDNIWDLAQDVSRGHTHFGLTVSWWLSIPMIVLILLAVNLLCIFMGAVPRLQAFIEYITLLGAFGLEFVYFLLLDRDFWFCNFDTQGWLRATLMFLLSMLALVVQYYRFMALLRHVMELTRPISTFIGLTLLKYWVIFFIVISIFNGNKLGDTSGAICVFGIMIMQIVQMLVTLRQLRSTPLVALGMAILLPLGALAILFSFIKILATAILFAIVGFVIYAWATSKGTGMPDQGGGRARGDAQHCPHCNYPYCDFITGNRSECSLINGDRCQHGQF
ncbi:MAG: hypothetical protein LBQ70_04285 [Prevotellaceae bacterium]|nr:hypothetical protein [Prevotellaceae bacterium]